jgi:hypothetical protein
MDALSYLYPFHPCYLWLLECVEVHRSTKHIKDHIHAMLVLK